MPPKRKYAKLPKKPIKSKAVVESDDDQASEAASDNELDVKDAVDADADDADADADDADADADADDADADDADAREDVSPRRLTRGSARVRMSTPVSVSLVGQKRSAPKATILSEDDNEFVPSPIHDSPTKKRRLVSRSPIKSDLLKTPTKSSPAKRRMHIPADSDMSELENSSNDEWAEHQQNFDNAIAKAKLNQINEKPEKGKKKVALEPLTEDTVYFEDLKQGHGPPSSVPRPSVCAVLNRNLVDPLLKRTYLSLGNLPGGYQNFGWRDIAPGDQESEQEPMINLSSIRRLYPTADINYFIKLISFSMDKKTNVINLSRVAFEDLIMEKPSPKSSSRMVYLAGQKLPALCVCFASVFEDRTREASTGLFPAKTLFAVMHQQEYEYKIANLCILLKVPFIRSQIDNNRWAFSTRPSNDGNAAAQTSLGFASSSSLTPKKSALTSGMPSPANSSKGTGETSLRSTTRYSLSSKDTVPVFDARYKKIQLPHGIRDVPKTFPLFRGEIPHDAIVLIGYSTAAYNAKRTLEDISVSLNIVWAAVLASADPPWSVLFPRVFFHDDPLVRMMTSMDPVD